MRIALEPRFQNTMEQLKKNWRQTLPSAVMAVLPILMSWPAFAELKLCNATSSRVGVAIGYRDEHGPATEGWWNIGAQTCESLLKSSAPSRYIYVYAIDYERGGEWSGTFAMCVADSSFFIRDVNDCEERGYRVVNFYEVDTGNAENWTIRLSDPEKPKSEGN